MLFTASAAFILGWAAPLPLAAYLLAGRGHDASPSHTPRTRLPARAYAILPRMACASCLSLFSCAVWQRSGDACAAACCTLAATCLLTALVCDVRARILPWELCAALLVFGSAYCLLERGGAELACALVLALACIAALACSRALAARLGRPCPIGAGDMRIVPGLFAACGLAGSVLGACACALFNGLWALGICACALVKRASARGRDTPSGGAAAATGCGAGDGEHECACSMPASASAKLLPAPEANGCDGAPQSGDEGMGTLAAQTLPMAPGLCVWFCVGVLCV